MMSYFCRKAYSDQYNHRHILRRQPVPLKMDAITAGSGA
jgi:hypothetical protein